MDEQRAWIRLRRKKRLRLLAAALCCCLLFTTYPNILETLSVLAAGTQDGDDNLYVSGFASLPEEVRKQTVPVGTAAEELTLPDTLDAFVIVEEDLSGEGEDAPDEGEKSDDSDKEKKSDAPDEDENSDSPDWKEEDENNAGETKTEQEGTAAETFATEEGGTPENSDNAENSGESAPSIRTEDAELTQETHTVTMPEYQAENVIKVETLENTQETRTKEEIVIIEGVTWQSEPAYDGNTEGTYIFTAILPEGYALMEGVSLPQITVTVQADSVDSVIQALLDKIAALPDVEAYLAKEPDTEEEEAYAEWMEGLYQYAGEALDIQEAYEALTEEQQASVSEEALAKLAAWVEVAEETVRLSAEVLADHSSHPVCGASCSHSSAHGSLSWTSFSSTGGTLGSGNYYLTGDVTITSKIKFESGSTVNLCLNGYKLNYDATSSEMFSVSGCTLTICDCKGGGEVDGGNHAIVYLTSSGTFNLYGGTLNGNATGNVINNGSSTCVVNVYGGTIAGGSKCNYSINTVGTVTIGGNAKVTGGSTCAVYNNSANGVIIVQDNASISSSSGAGINSGMGTVTIKGGTVAGNTYGINMSDEAGSLTLEGTPVISSETAALYLRTASGTTLDNAKVDATDYNGSTLLVEEYSTENREGAYAIKVSDRNKDKFTLSNDGDVIYQYKDGGLMLHTHTHSYTYTADGAVITESCSCGHKEMATLCQKQDANLTYTGSAIKPVTVSYSSGWVGSKPADSAITYSDNINAGSNATASLKISNATASLTFTIAPKPLTADMITLASDSYSYTGSAIMPAVTVTDGETLTSGTDYTVSYADNVNVGTGAKVTVTGKGNYSGSASKTFRITAADISSATVTLSSATLTYNGSAQTIGVSSVKIGNTPLTEGTDYTISGNIGTNAGSYTITITGIGGYAGSTKTVTFRIEPKPLTADMITLASDSYSYTGSAITPAVTVHDGDRNMDLTKVTDYTVSYADNVNAGTATVTVTGTGNYSGSISKTFTIAYSPLPSGKSLTDYVTISPEPTNGWYNTGITLTPKDGCGVGETPAGIGSNAVIISQETGTDGSTKTIYIKDGEGNIYQTEFPYKLDKTPPVVDLTNMTVENGTKGLWNWIIGKKSMIIKIPASDVTDAPSGIAEVSYTAQPDSGTSQSGTLKGQGGYYQIALNEQFGGTIRLTVKDNAGNTTQVSLTADSGKVIAEDYAPVVTFALPDTLTPNGWYNTAITVTVMVTDNKDSGDNAVISGGIAEIRWKDGENGTVQTVTGLPGTLPVCEKEFTISVNTDGIHTYYVNAADNAGNESGWQTVTVKVDTGRPEFRRDITVTNLTQEGADITFTPSEGGKVYYIVSDTGTAPTAQEVKEQSGQKGGVQDIAGDTEKSFTITGLSAGEKHTVYVVLEDAAGNLSDVKTESFFTLQEAPNITKFTVDYTNETITLPDGIGNVEVYTDPSDPSGSKITPNADGSLPVTPGTAVYIRYPEKTQDGLTMPASGSVKIDIPGRPDRPAAKQVTVTDTTAIVTNPVPGEEYILVPRGQASDRTDWSNANTTGQFEGLDPNKEYDLYVRKEATGSSFASEPVKKEIRTSVTIKEPVITGEGEGVSGNTAVKPDTPNTDGTVTFTGTYSEEYTPVIRAGGSEILPGDGTAESEMAWNEKTKKGTWEYTLTMPDGATEAEITVEFRRRVNTGITAEPDTLSIYADHEANVSMDALTAYVKANSSAQAAYDNKTSGTVQAIYTAAGSFAQKGGTYAYTASAEGKTDNITLTVNPVSVAVTTPDKCIQMQKTGGYTASEVAAWLPAQVKVTYTGDGYKARTENRTVTWSTASIGSGFGAAAGTAIITGTVDLPAWAAGQNAVSIDVQFVDKYILTDSQMTFSVSGWIYGAQAAPDPRGRVTVTDTDPTYTYLYSMDGGANWVTADRLPRSSGGYIIPGEYQAKMVYMGDHYTGEKTIVFTVKKKSLTVQKGTLEAEDKNYDGTIDAALKEGTEPAISGVMTDDAVSLGGSLSAVFKEKGPKKNIPVTVTGFLLEGGDAGNYELKNTTLTLYATINNEDGTPPKSSGGNSGSKDSGDDDHDDGGNSNNEDGSNAQGNTDQSKPDAEPEEAGEKGAFKDAYEDTGTSGAAPTAAGSVDGMTADETILHMGSGAVIVTVVCEEEACTAGVSDTAAVVNAVLSPEQIQLVNDGETIEIRVDVKDISNTVSGQDKEVIESGLAEYRKEMPDLTLGMYIDISMFVRIGEGDWDAVTETTEPIDVVIGIPEELKGDGRKFTIIRSHDGEYTLLPDTDDDPDTITVSTNLFSAYAIAYGQADEAKVQTSGENSAECGLCHICPTFFGICCFIWLAVILVAVAVIWIVIWRKKKEGER